MLMKKSKYSGNYTKAFLSSDVSPLDSIEQTYYSNTIKLEENEAGYIYSFKDNKLIFSKGMDSLFGVDIKDVNILWLNEIYHSDFQSFVNEYHDRLLLYLYNHNQNLTGFLSRIIIKTSLFETPLMLTIKVLKTDEGGNLISILGIVKKSELFKTSKVVQYSLDGIEDEHFMNKINFSLDFEQCISEKNIELLELLESKMSKSEIALKLGLNEIEISIRISNLKKRFEISSRQELIEFAVKNNLIPNQFKIAIEGK